MTAHNKHTSGNILLLVVRDAIPRMIARTNSRFGGRDFVILAQMFKGALLRRNGFARKCETPSGHTGAKTGPWLNHAPDGVRVCAQHVDVTTAVALTGTIICVWALIAATKQGQSGHDMSKARRYPGLALHS